MESQKIYLADGGKSDYSALLATALQNRGVDPSVLAMLGNNNGGLFGGRGFEDIIALIVVAAIFGNGNFGFGGNGNRGGADTERQMLMDAIQRNGIDINSLASSFNCSVGQINNGINAVATQICNLTGQLGMSSQQIINSVERGNSTLASQICSCCCDLKQLVTAQGYENQLANERQTTYLLGAIDRTNTGVERGFSQTAFETQRQTCDIIAAIKDNTAQVLAGQRAAEMREMQDKIDHLREENGTFKSSAMTSQIVGQAIAPIAAGLAAVQKEVSDIACKQPKTETVYAPSVVGLPTCLAAQFGLLNGFGLGLGFPNGFNNAF